MAQKKPLRISIIGAGPAGLYTAILARQHLSDAVIEVIEQNPKGATFGFGVVFSDKALDFLSAGRPSGIVYLPACALTVSIISLAHHHSADERSA